MAAEPIHVRLLAACLTPFEPAHAPLVALWLSRPRDALWAAPRTPPPITADKVRAWGAPQMEQWVLRVPDESQPVGYGELNVLRQDRGEYWIGHLVVDPQRRGRGYGRRLTELLLERAARQHQARRVSLVVFPDNLRAMACYQAAGMRFECRETQYFPPYRRYVHLIRMTRTWDPR